MRNPWTPLLIGTLWVLACELDVQLDPGDLPSDLDLDELPVHAHRGCVQSDLSGLFLVAVETFAQEPPLQFSMCVIFQETSAGGRSIIGWTRRHSPYDRRLYGDSKLYGGPEFGFAIELEETSYWTHGGPVEMAPRLLGSVVSDDFLCGRVEPNISGLYRPLGKLTFAARRLDDPLRLPVVVEVDCSGRTVPAV